VHPRPGFEGKLAQWVEAAQRDPDGKALRAYLLERGPGGDLAISQPTVVRARTRSEALRAVVAPGVAVCEAPKAGEQPAAPIVS
jgi:hypothetical protein